MTDHHQLQGDVRTKELHKQSGWRRWKKVNKSMYLDQILVNNLILFDIQIKVKW